MVFFEMIFCYAQSSYKNVRKVTLVSTFQQFVPSSKTSGKKVSTFIDFYFNHIYNKMLDCDWFSVHLFDMQLEGVHMDVQLQQIKLNFLQLGSCNQTTMLCTSIRYTEMGSFYSCFSTACKTDDQKYITKGHLDFLILHFVIDTINW